MPKSQVQPSFDYREIKEEEFLVMVSKSHKYADRAGIDSEGNRYQCQLEWFKDDYWSLEPPGATARYVSNYFFEKINYTPKIFADNCTRAMLMELANKGLCTVIALDTLLPYYDNLVGFSLTPRTHFTMVAAKRKNYKYSKPEQVFVDLVCKYYGSKDL